MEKLEDGISVVLSEQPLSSSKVNALLSANSKVGGIVLFTGLVRNVSSDRKVLRLEFESHAPMAVKEMTKIAREALGKWPLEGIIIHHRVGSLEIGEVPVVIGVSARHRDAAFDACRFCIDTLKETVPIWKKEIFEDGEAWVSAHP